MKLNLRYSFAVLLALLIFFCFSVFFIVPKVVAITLPYRWDNLPIGQKQFVLHQYLGAPLKTASLSTGSTTEEWVAKRDNGEYVLTVFYNPKDSIATNYALVFNYHLGFFHKQYDLTPNR